VVNIHTAGVALYLDKTGLLLASYSVGTTFILHDKLWKEKAVYFL